MSGIGAGTSPLWGLRAGGTGFDEGIAVAVAANGDVLMTGDVVGPVDFGGGFTCANSFFLADSIGQQIFEPQHGPDARIAALDKSQAQGVHEKKILVGDILEDRQAFSSHFAVGESQTHQILHTKGGVLDNVLAFEGSTNWSASGEGSGIGLHGSPNLTGFRAQANSLTVHTNPYEIAKFAAVLDHWYDVAAAQPQPAYDQWASQGNGAEPAAAKPAGAHPAAGAAAH